MTIIFDPEQLGKALVEPDKQEEKGIGKFIRDIHRPPDASKPALTANSPFLDMLGETAAGLGGELDRAAEDSYLKQMVGQTAEGAAGDYRQFMDDPVHAIGEFGAFSAGTGPLGMARVPRGGFPKNGNVIRPPEGLFRSNRPFDSQARGKVYKGWANADDPQQFLLDQQRILNESGNEFSQMAAQNLPVMMQGIHQRVGLARMHQQQLQRINNVHQQFDTIQTRGDLRNYVNQQLDYLMNAEDEAIRRRVKHLMNQAVHGATEDQKVLAQQRLDALPTAVKAAVRDDLNIPEENLSSWTIVQDINRYTRNLSEETREEWLNGGFPEPTTENYTPNLEFLPEEGFSGNPIVNRLEDIPQDPDGPVVEAVMPYFKSLLRNILDEDQVFQQSELDRHLTHLEGLDIRMDNNGRVLPD